MKDEKDEAIRALQRTTMIYIQKKIRVCILIFCSTILFGQASPPPPKFRLPTTVAPEHYKVDLTLVPDKDRFSGAIELAVNFKEPTSVLWLNAEKLTIKNATLSFGAQKLIASVIAQPKDLAGFSFEHAVGPGRAKLRVEYEGQISRKDRAGIFQMKDRDHWYIYSQFENISARRAFPCFDEPGYKVSWQVTLNVPAEDGAFSNTPPTSERSAGAGMKAVEFAETKPLPSYLVAFAVGPMDIVQAGHTAARNAPIRIVVPKGHSAEAQYAATTTRDIINLLEKYFGIPYPYDKLDEVAVPLFPGAMENAGLVTYGTRFFLMKSDTPLATKRLATSIMAHELAHQWFGDLVTMAWWDDTWLNEAFASWMANKIVSEYRPEWKMNIDELNSYQEAMETDELVSARSVRQPIHSNDDIENAFDDITYQKGSGLLNMFESYIGAKTFRQRIEGYLNKYSWKNATAADFLHEIGGSDSELTKAFSSFLDQPGVPLVGAKLDCGSGSAGLEVFQQRFLPRGSQGHPNELWKIPVCVEYPSAEGEGRQCVLVTGKSQNLAFSKGERCPQWFYANAGQAGYYRVLYEAPILAALGSNETALGLAERVGFLGDLAALSKDRVPLGEAMALVPKFAQDPSPEVVSKTVAIVGDLDDHFVPDQLKPSYRRYLSNLYRQRAESLGAKDRPEDSPEARLLRPRLFRLMANHAEDPQFIAEARKLAVAWLDDHSAVDRDMLGTVLDSAAEHGERAFFDRLREQAKRESDEDVQFRILRALGHFRDPKIVKFALELILGSDFDPRQSVFGILFGAQSTSVGREAAYEFVKQNWDALIAKLPSDSGASLPEVATGFCDEQHRADAEAFFAGRSTKYTGGPRILAQVLERISICAANRNAGQESVSVFLSKY